MDAIRSLSRNLVHQCEPQIHLLQFKARLLNEQLRTVFSPLQLITITALVTTFGLSIYRFIFAHDEDISTRLREVLFRLVRRLPAVQRQIEKARKDTLTSICNDIAKSVAGHQFAQTLPTRGLTKEELFEKLDQYHNFEKVDFQSGQVSGCVYKIAKSDMNDIYQKVLSLFGESNPLHVDIFPDIRTMEAEVVRCVAAMFHGDQDVCGTMTSGGTESLIMACKTYRDLAVSKGITKPEIVMPITAHPAINKACSYLKIKLKRVPLNPHTREVDLDKMRKALTKNTCLLVASAPNFPHGVIDPIEDIAKLAIQHRIPLHVDACLGGFLVAFMDQAGYPVRPFDFRVPGVTSISCDTHKYGFAPKGTSVILYRDDTLRQHQFFALADWPGGIYGSPSVAGSRSGYLIACCWATLMFYGVEGYIEETRRIVQTARAIAQGWSEIGGLYLLHQPDVSVVAISSEKFNIYYLYDALHSKGWHLIGLQNPAGLHIAVTQVHTQPGVVEKLLEDTRECVKEILRSDSKKDTVTAVIYGTNQKVPDKSLICDMTKLYIRSWYDTNLDTSNVEKMMSS